MKGKLFVFVVSSFVIAGVASVSDSVRSPYVSWKVELAAGVVVTTALFVVFARPRLSESTGETDR
jgi:hypothetical protein